MPEDREPTEPFRTCFLAIGIPADLASSIAAWVRPLLGREARLVAPDRFHVTVVYYGRVRETSLPGLSAAIGQKAGAGRPLRLGLGAAGRFGNGRVLWVGVEGEVAALAALRAEILVATAGFGEASTREPVTDPAQFTPHVTVARARGRRISGPRFVGAPTPWGPSEDFTCDRVTLFETAGGRYLPLGEFPLGA